MLIESDMKQNLPSVVRTTVRLWFLLCLYMFVKFYIYILLKYVFKSEGQCGAIETCNKTCQMFSLNQTNLMHFFSSFKCKTMNFFSEIPDIIIIKKSKNINFQTYRNMMAQTLFQQFAAVNSCHLLYFLNLKQLILTKHVWKRKGILKLLQF